MIDVIPMCENVHSDTGRIVEVAGELMGRASGWKKIYHRGSYIYISANKRPNLRGSRNGLTKDG